MTNLLVVEDSPTQAHALQLALEDDGFEVTVAGSGEEALWVLERTDHDMVITDVVMPGMTGYELCRRVKARKAELELPVLLLTTLRDPMDIIEGLDCGADGFLVKPCDPQLLVERVRTLLSTRKLRMEGKLRVGAEVFFMGRRISIASEKEQILRLLISSFEETLRTNRELQDRERELAVANLRLDEYARGLEGQLSVSSERYRRLMETATDAIFVLDSDARILDSNLAAERLTGKAATALSGCSFLDLVAAPDDQVAQVRAVLQEDGGRMSDLPLRREGGPPVATDVSASTLRTGDSRTTLAILRDMTERNRRDRQLRENEKLALMGTIAAGVAHEINNPLAFVQANVNFGKEFISDVRDLLSALERAADALPPQAKEALLAQLREHKASQMAEDMASAMDDAVRGISQIAEIVRDLKAFSRADEDMSQPLDINSVVEWSLRVTSGQLKFAARLEKELADSLPTISGVPGRLGQVFTNLLVNASQAFDGQRNGQQRIRISTRLDGPYVAVEIEDNGRGIKPEHLELLFEPFFTTKPAGVGTGLGLPICRDIVRAHRGEITVRSEEGSGTTFTVRFPVL